MIYRNLARGVVSLALLVSLAACNSNERTAKEYVRQSAKDPDSVKFGDFYFNSELNRACITVNAKNSMGGYTGNQQVALLKDEQGWGWISTNEETQETCRKTWADNTAIPS